jgi:hypothetical protein
MEGVLPARRGARKGEGIDDPEVIGSSDKKNQEAVEAARPY